MAICQLCKHRFKPIVHPQKFCSGTCARAVKDIDELGRVYADLDARLVASWEQRRNSETEEIEDVTPKS
jgi:predicted P-loop ATPase